MLKCYVFSEVLAHGLNIIEFHLIPNVRCLQYPHFRLEVEFLQDGGGGVFFLSFHIVHFLNLNGFSAN